VHPSAGQDLSRRLKALREQTWPGRVITQKQLALALSSPGRTTSVPLISSWESARDPKLPPEHRLEAYARFFATERSIQASQPRLLPLVDLTETEKARYDELLAELTALRLTLSDHHDTTGAAAVTASSAWHFPDGFDILLVCARMPDDVVGPTTDPDDPDYLELYTYGDLDSLIELYGHLRATNPNSNVNFARSDQLVADDYTKHLVLLGGVDWNELSRALPNRVGIPVQQISRLGTDEPSGFEVTGDSGERMFSPHVESGVLLEDVAHFYRGPNPFNVMRTVTICNGMFGRGTYGAVRALTDAKFRVRNDAYLRDRLEQHDEFSLLMRVQVFMGTVVTPDWTVEDTRLHQWPEVDN
jgi:hypothetical protein